MVNAPQSIVSGETFVLTVQDVRAVARVAMMIAESAAAPGTITRAFTVDAAPDPATPGQWLIRSDSKNWLPGDYQFEIWADDANGNRVFIDRGAFAVTPSLSGSQPDTRSIAQRNVDALEAYLSGVGQPGTDQSVAEYKIKDRELRNYTLSEIRLLLGYWRRRLIREQREAMGLRGRPGIKVFI